MLALRRLKQQTVQVRGVFKDVRLFAGHMAKLSADNPMRYVADAGSVAVHQYAALKPRVDYDTWLIRAIEQALNTLQTRLQGGMALRELLRTRTTRRRQVGEVPMVDDGRQAREDRFDVFVAHRTEHRMCAREIRHLIQVLH